MQFSERELEDWFFENPSEFVAATPCTCGDFYWIGRQVAVPSGVIDLLGICGCFRKYPTIYVVELKADRLRSGAIGQVSRYSRDIEMSITDADPDRIVQMSKWCVGVGHIDDYLHYEAGAADVELLTVRPAFTVDGPWSWTEDKKERDEASRFEIGKSLLKHIAEVCPETQASEVAEVADGTQS